MGDGGSNGCGRRKLENRGQMTGVSTGFQGSEVFRRSVDQAAGSSILVLVLVLVLVLETSFWRLTAGLWSTDFADGLERKEKNQSTDYAD